MRPSPLFLLVLVTVGLGLIAVPLVRLTGASAASRPGPAAAPDPTATAPRIPTWLRLRFTHPPERVSLRQDGRELAEVAMPTDNPIVASLTLSLPPEGIELLVEATWPAGTPTTALGVELEPDGYDSRATTLWTDTATVSEIVSFQWK